MICSPLFCLISYLIPSYMHSLGLPIIRGRYSKIRKGRKSSHRKEGMNRCSKLRRRKWQYIYQWQRERINKRKEPKTTSIVIINNSSSYTNNMMIMRCYRWLTYHYVLLLLLLWSFWVFHSFWMIFKEKKRKKERESYKEKNNKTHQRRINQQKGMKRCDETETKEN